jgi:hypothetical protein
LFFAGLPVYPTLLTHLHSPTQLSTFLAPELPVSCTRILF